MKKQVYRLSEAEVSVRIGTRDIVSGALIAPETRPEDIVRGGYANGGGNVYALKHSLRVRPYGINPFEEYDGEGLVVLGKLSPSEFIIAPEYESNNLEGVQKRLEIYARCAMLPTADCTVQVEYLGRPRASCHGFRALAENMERLVGAVESNCGTHLNFSTKTMRDSIAERGLLVSHYGELFEPLLQKISADGSTVRREFFGSDWRGYASATTDWTSHECWMGLRRARANGRNCIEFRLPRARTPEHLERCAFLCKEWSIEIDKFLQGKQTAEEAGRQIVHQYELAKAGKARWQKRVK